MNLKLKLAFILALLVGEMGVKSMSHQESEKGAEAQQINFA